MPVVRCKPGHARPPGAAAKCISLPVPLLLYPCHACRGVYLVAADRDDAEGWVDAILLLAHLLRAGRMGGVKAALSVR